MSGVGGRLAGKVAIITGGAGGQGAVEARLFAAEGCRLLVTDVDPAGAGLADEIGDAAHFMVHDVADEAGWKAVVAQACALFGTVDILINNAGVFRPGTIEETSSESFDLHYRVNQLGLFLGVRSVLGAMRQRGGGSIVNVSSAAGLRGFPGIIAYSATKWASHGMTKAMAAELAPDKIRVNSIHPGLVATRMLDDHSPDALAAFTAAVPLKRVAEAQEIADLALYLASDAASYVTGAAIPIDGGIAL